MCSQFWLLLLLLSSIKIFFIFFLKKRIGIVSLIRVKMGWCVSWILKYRRVMCVYFVHMRHLNACRLFVGWKVSWHLNEVAESNVDISVRFGGTFCIYIKCWLCIAWDMTFPKQANKQSIGCINLACKMAQPILLNTDSNDT